MDGTEQTQSNADGARGGVVKRLENADAEVTALSWACLEAGKMQRYYELQGEAAGVRLALSILGQEGVA